MPYMPTLTQNHPNVGIYDRHGVSEYRKDPKGWPGWKINLYECILVFVFPIESPSNHLMPSAQAHPNSRCIMNMIYNGFREPLNGSMAGLHPTAPRAPPPDRAPRERPARVRGSWSPRSLLQLPELDVLKKGAANVQPSLSVGTSCWACPMDKNRIKKDLII